MSKDKFLESIPKLSDFAFNDNAVLSAYNDIEDVYQTYIRHTNKHVYRYFYVAAGYLLNTKNPKQRPAKIINGGRTSIFPIA